MKTHYEAPHYVIFSIVFSLQACLRHSSTLQNFLRFMAFPFWFKYSCGMSASQTGQDGCRTL